MSKFPLYKQYDKMDCGPTCLRMIASYYGVNFTLESLREKSHFKKQGVSILGLSEAAESIGFRTMAALVSFDELKELTYPCIVHWQQVHFVVVYKIKNTTNEV